MDIEDLPFRFKKGSRAIASGEYSIVGDIHLGFEEDINSRGYNVWEKTEEITDEIKSLRSKKLILLGDIRKEYTEIKPKEGGILIKFFSILSDNFDEIIITKGNHDGGLEKITGRFANISMVNEFILGKIGFMHGHTLPSKKFAQEAETLCMSHLHPSVVLRDSNGVYYQKDCFFVLSIGLPEKLYPKSVLKKGIVVPKFNPYIGSSADVDYKGVMKYAEIDSRMTIDLAVF